MKKTKLLIPFLATAAIAGTIAPLVSCNDKTPETKKGNLMTEYKPTHKRYVQLDEDQFSEPSDVVNTYLSEVSTDPEIFAQDLIYTMSRGLPQYVAYVSDFCEISGQDYNVEIPLDKIVVDGSTITSQIKLTMFYDYSETKPEELL
ncbi:MAG: hypothetical protein MJ195_02810 [Mycoplasmoidaceae bacterium]|nr:hypothetical protein [Mycoplasmoidaceae bacterium]